MVNETDRELLVWAAKAAKIEGEIKDHGGVLWLFRDDFGSPWNPITDDGDAFRLAVKCRLEIGFPAPRKVWSFGRKGDVCSEEYKSDPLDATRRVIVRAAAEIGRNMP